MKEMIKYQLIVILMMIAYCLNSQSFEGSITYKLTADNPNPEMVSDSMWQSILKQQFGERGYMVQRYFYKESNYVSEIDAGTEMGYQAYNPKDGLLYSWQKGSDEAITLNSKKYLDKFVEILEHTELDTILGIPCKSIVVKSSLGSMTIWYNSDHFKMDAKFYEGHIYGHWEHILKKIGCLPIKMKQEGFMGKITLEATDFKKEELSESRFVIPDFKEVSANPMN